MMAIALGAFGAALFASAASAAPLNATTIGSAEVVNVDQVRLVCNEYDGRCWRIRAPRYVLRFITTTPATSLAGATTTTLAPATTIAATDAADQGSSFAAGSPLGLPVPLSLFAPAEEVIE